MPLAKLSTGIDLYYESHGQGDAVVFIPATYGWKRKLKSCRDRSRSSFTTREGAGAEMCYSLGKMSP